MVVVVGLECKRRCRMKIFFAELRGIGDVQKKSAYAGSGRAHLERRDKFVALPDGFEIDPGVSTAMNSVKSPRGEYVWQHSVLECST